MAVVVVAPEPVETAEAQILLGALDEFLSSLYPPEDNFLELASADVDGMSGVFLVARIDGAAIGTRLLPATSWRRVRS